MKTELTPTNVLWTAFKVVIYAAMVFFALTFVFIFIYGFCVFLQSKYIAVTVAGYMSIFFFYAAVININLAIFNLLPIPPLDGSRLATALLPSHIYYKIMAYERYIQIGLFVLLFTGILSTPLSFLSGAITQLFMRIALSVFQIL